MKEVFKITFGIVGPLLLGFLIAFLIVYPSMNYIIKKNLIYLILFIPFLILGISIWLFIELTKKEWKKISYNKQSLIIASIIYLLVAIGFTIWFVTISLLGGYKCPALVDTVSCNIKQIHFYVSQMLLLIGIPLFLAVVFFRAFWLVEEFFKNKPYIHGGGGA